MAPITELAQGVADLLNGAGFGQTINAERSYQQHFQLPELATAKVTVYGFQDRTLGRATIADWDHELTVGVAVQQKLADDELSAQDDLVELANRICEYVKAQWNETARPQHLLLATVDTLDNDLLRTNRLFTVVVKLTFGVHY